MRTIKTAPRREHLRVALLGPKVSETSYGALQLAYGLTEDWSKIAAIGASILPTVNYPEVLCRISLGQSETPSYGEAIMFCEKCNVEVIVMEGIKPEWLGSSQSKVISAIDSGSNGGSYHLEMRKVMSFASAFQSVNAHIIVTLRTPKRQVTEEDSYGSYFTTVLSLDAANVATVIKDQTGVCKELCPVVISPKMGDCLRVWYEDDDPTIPPDLQRQINDCQDLKQLYSLLFSLDLPVELLSAFTKRRLELERSSTTNASQRA